MKRKNLIKKITALEARLQKGAKKLAKLKRKLAASTTSSAEKIKKKSVARDGAGDQMKVSAREQKPKAKAVASGKAKRPSRKAKRKLNLSPERRAQLAAAMKARWAAKRAAEGTPPAAATNRDFTLGQTPQSP